MVSAVFHWFSIILFSSENHLWYTQEIKKTKLCILVTLSWFLQTYVFLVHITRYISPGNKLYSPFLFMPFVFKVKYEMINILHPNIDVCLKTDSYLSSSLTRTLNWKFQKLYFISIDVREPYDIHCSMSIELKTKNTT